jgi:histone chaperone ASF1
MTFINVSSIEILSNPAEFTSPLRFKITFECLRDIPDEVEWKLIYVGSSKDQKYDQVLDSFSMGPLEYGVMQFDLESNPPDSSKIPKDDLLGITAIILTVSYHEEEFFRVGYYVYNNYLEPELLENPPEQILLEKVFRNILADKPRITRFDIKSVDKDAEETQESTQPNSNKISTLKEFEESNFERYPGMMIENCDSRFENFVKSKNPFFITEDEFSKMVEENGPSFRLTEEEFTG